MIPYSVVLVAAAIGVLPVAIWLFVVTKYNQKHPRGVSFFMNVFFLGVLSAIPASIVEIVINETESTNQITQAMLNVYAFKQVEGLMPALISTFLVAIIEEFSKGLGIIISIYSKKFKIHNDGIVYGALIGLAFAVTENGVYFANALHDPETGSLSSVIILRFLLSTTAHIIYSGFLGKFLADSVLATNRLGKITTFFLAFAIPITTHTIFNFLLSTSLSWMISIIIAFGIFLLWYFYSENSDELDPVENDPVVVSRSIIPPTDIQNS